eukprot:m.219608 g.219608  ORF g.219608 m.219608 type:complete len:104 (-) comp19157_c0_seq53:4246-4557(-)
MSPVSFVLPMLMFVALMPISAGSSSFDTHINSRKGFVGSYHVTNSSVPGGTTKVNQVLNLGISAIENTASDGGWGLRGKRTKWNGIIHLECQNIFRGDEISHS